VGSNIPDTAIPQPDLVGLVKNDADRYYSFEIGSNIKQLVQSSWTSRKRGVFGPCYRVSSVALLPYDLRDASMP
jgi:hypothetical protein